MDDQNKSPGIQSPQPVSQPQNQSKVLRPSQSFVEELKTTAATSPTTDNTTPAASGPVRPSPASIYPEAKQYTMPTPQSPATNDNLPKEAVKGDNKSKVINVLIILFGVYTVATAILGLIGGVKLLSFGVVGKSGGLITFISIVELIIGVGIVLRRELARVAYIVVAIIFLCLSADGTYRYFQAIQTNNNSQQKYIASTKQEISQYQNDTSIPASQKTQLIQQVQNTENSELQLLSKEKTSLFPIIEGYIIAIIPLIFLTLPPVKEEFS